MRRTPVHVLDTEGAPDGYLPTVSGGKFVVAPPPTGGGGTGGTGTVTGARVTYTSAITLSQTATTFSTTNWRAVSAALDLVFPGAAAGGIIDTSLNFQLTNNSVDTVFNLEVIKDGAHVRYCSTGKFGITGWTSNGNDGGSTRKMVGNWQEQIQPGDIASDGSVTVRLVYQQVATATRSINASVDNPARIQGLMFT